MGGGVLVIETNQAKHLWLMGALPPGAHTIVGQVVKGLALAEERRHRVICIAARVINERGAAYLPELRARSPEAVLLLTTEWYRWHEAQEAFSGGAFAYVEKSDERVFRAAVRAAQAKARLLRRQGIRALPPLPPLPREASDLRHAQRRG
jgi:DNA-binding NtrC family response regulator